MTTPRRPSSSGSGNRKVPSRRSVKHRRSGSSSPRVEWVRWTGGRDAEPARGCGPTRSSYVSEDRRRQRTQGVRAAGGCGGEGGIRTRDGLPQTAFPVRRHSPLGDLSPKAYAGPAGGRPVHGSARVVAERAGFEPAVLSHTAFRERHHQPLGHLSAGEDTKGSRDDPAVAWSRPGAGRGPAWAKRRGRTVWRRVRRSACRRRGPRLRRGGSRSRP